MELSDNETLHTPKQQKITGYMLRLSAILLWGAGPIILKYNLASFNPFFVYGFSMYVALLFWIPVYLFRLLRHRLNGKKKTCRPVKGYNRFFFMAIVFDALEVLLITISVHFTIASNTTLLLNFSPVIALLFFLVFARNRIAYLKGKNDTLNILIVFIAGCVGSSMLVFNQLPNETGNKMLGDLIAFGAVLCDVAATVSLIHYARQNEAFSGIDYIIRKIAIIALLFFPIVLTGLPQIMQGLSISQIASFVYMGVFDFALAYMLAFEAFKRIDGLIAYLLFNLRPIITILLEVVVFALPLSINFSVGAVLIMGASIAAEIINSKAQKLEKKTVLLKPLSVRDD